MDPGLSQGMAEITTPQHLCGGCQGWAADCAILVAGGEEGEMAASQEEGRGEAEGCEWEGACW